MIRGAGGFIFLLSHELRLMLRIGVDPSRKHGRALMLFFAALLLFTGYFVATWIAPLTPSFEPLFLTVASIMIATTTTLMLGHALIAVTDAIYTRGDLDLLLSSPFSSWTVLTVRTLGVVMRVGGTYFVLLAGVSFWLLVFGAFRWLSPLAALFGLALWSTAAGIVLAMAMFATIGPRATRITAQITGALVGASIFLLFQLQNLDPANRRGDRWAALAQQLTQIEAPSDHPLFLPARAFLGDPQALAIWTGGAIVAFTLVTLWFSRRFVRDAAAVVGAGRKKRVSLKPAKPMRGGVTASVLRKELRLIVRDPVLLSQVLMQLIYLVPLVLVMGGGALRSGEISGGFVGVVGAALAVIGASLAGALAWVTISAEDAPDLVSAAPVDRAAIERGKVLAASAPVILIALAVGLLIAPFAPLGTFFLVLGVSAAAVSAALIGLWHQEPGTRKDFRRRPRATFAAQFGQFLSAAAWSAATGLAAAGGFVAPLAIFPALVALGLLAALHESRRPDDATIPAVVPVSTKKPRRKSA